MIYITGDTHIPEDIQKLGTKVFPVQKELEKNDFVIICGDFGGVWDNSPEEHYWRRWLEKKPFTTLFVDGNHENFDMLKEFPKVDFHGGTAQKISDSIFRLMRGQVYEIDGKKIFTFGGAASHDREYRKEGKNWWREEMPTAEEFEEGIKNLSNSAWQTDYVITHCAPTSVQSAVAPLYKSDELTEYLEKINNTLSYKKWFFGHYHKDMVADESHIAVFNDIIKIS